MSAIENHFVNYTFQAANGHDECVEALLHNQADVLCRYVPNREGVGGGGEVYYSYSQYIYSVIYLFITL